MNKKITFAVAVLFFLSLSFLFGVFFENKKFYPYLEIKDIYQKVNNILIRSNKEKDVTKKEKKSEINQFEFISFNYENSKIIETSTLRLEKSEIDLSNYFFKSNKMKSRGGICSIGDHLIVVSASGESILIDDKKKQKLFFDINSLFNEKTNKINIVQDILCLDKNKNNIISFLVNIQFNEKEALVEGNYKGNFSSNVFQIDIENLKKINIKKKIFKSKNHGINWAGRMIKKDDNLYISFSSRDANKENEYDMPLSQDERYLEGKIIKINLSDNSNSIFSKGHRNPQGLALIDDMILSTEHGPRGGDELNIINENQNYGWPLVTHGTTYADFKAYDYIKTIPGRHDGFKKPIFSWSPGLGISNLVEILNFDNSWNKDVLISSLKNMSLYRVRILDKRILFAERIWVGNRIRDITMSKDGKIFLWTDNKKIIKLVNANYKKDLNVVRTGYDINKITPCLSCHYLNSGDKPSSNLVAPTLSKIFERNIASDEDYDYSKALKSFDGQWTKLKMAKYLTDPQKFAPGTYKSYKIKSQTEAFDIIEQLEKLSISGD